MNPTKLTDCPLPSRRAHHQKDNGQAAVSVSAAVATFPTRASLRGAVAQVPAAASVAQGAAAGATDSLSVVRSVEPAPARSSALSPLSSRQALVPATPSRRSWRDGFGTAAGTLRDRAEETWSTITSSRRAVVTGAGLAVIGVGAAVGGFAVVPGQAQAAVGAFGASDSWGSDALAPESVPNADSLVARHAAASRAKMRTPLVIDACTDVEQAADGARPVEHQAQTYYPMRAGTYTKTSSYGWRISPISGQMKIHEGDDWAAPAGTPIYAVADGVVETAQLDGGRGNYTKIKHQKADGTVFYSAYLHQLDGSFKITAGQTVKAGQEIGAVGSTGNSTGPHLHIEIRDAQDNDTDPTASFKEMGATDLAEGCS